MELANKLEIIQNYGLNLDKACIYIASEIDSTLSTYLRIKVDMIEEYYKEELGEELERVKLFLNSPGGDIYSIGAVLDFFNELKERNILVDTHSEGMCQSAATFIIAGGTGKRTSSKNCRWKIHEIQITTLSEQTQTPSQAKREQDEYDFLQKDYYKRYAEITCKRKNNLSKVSKDWEELCKHTHYFSSFEAKKLGLIDEVIKY